MNYKDFNCKGFFHYFIIGIFVGYTGPYNLPCWRVLLSKLSSRDLLLLQMGFMSLILVQCQKVSFIRIFDMVKLQYSLPTTIGFSTYYTTQCSIKNHVNYDCSPEHKQLYLHNCCRTIHIFTSTEPERGSGWDLILHKIQ